MSCLLAPMVLSSLLRPLRFVTAFLFWYCFGQLD